MKKIINIFIAFILVSSFVLPYTAASAAETENRKSWEESTEVPTNKTWEITFNKPIDRSAPIKPFVYVLDSKKEKVDVLLSFNENKKKLFIEPPVEGYEPSSEYILVIEEGIKATSNQQMNQAIHKKFKTKNEKELSREFKAREDSKNEMKLKDNIIFESNKNIISKKYSLNMIMKNSKNYKTGQIIAFPNNKEYPFGFIGKVSKIKEKNQQIILTLVEPKIEEILSELDVSKEEKINIANVKTSDELTNQKLSPKFLEKSGITKPSTKISGTSKGFILNIDDIGFEVDGSSEISEGVNISGKGGVKLSGSLEFSNMKVNSDIEYSIFKGISFNTLGFQSDETVALKAEVFGNVSGTFERKLLDIPVPYLSAGKGPIGLGVFIEVYVVFNVSSDGKVTYEMKQKFRTDVGITKDENSKYNPFIDQSSLETGVSQQIDQKIELDMNSGVKAATNLQLLGLNLLEVNSTPRFQAKFTGEKNLGEETKSCSKVELNFLLDITLEVLKSLEKDISLTKSKDFPIYSWQNCKLEKITFAENEKIVKPSESGYLILESNKNRKKVNVDLPKKNISFSSNKSEVKVNASGKYTIAKHLPTNFEATVSMHYIANNKKYTEELKLYGKDQSSSLSPYKSNFSVKNNSNRNERVIVSQGGEYIIYSKNGDIENQEINSSKSIILEPGNELIISYLNNSALLPYVEGNKNQIIVKKTNESSFVRLDLKKNESAKLTVNEGLKFYFNPVGFLGEKHSGALSYLTYTSTGDIDDQIINRPVSSDRLSVFYLTEGGEAELNNTNKVPITIYASKRNYKIVRQSQGIFSKKVLLPGEKAIVIMKQGTKKNSSQITILDDDGLGKYNYTTYDSLGNIDKIVKNQKVVEFSWQSFHILKNGKAKITNTSKVPITIYGSIRFFVIS